VYDHAKLPVLLAGNVFPANPSGIRLVPAADGVYLEIPGNIVAPGGEPRKLVTTELLGKTVLTQQTFTLPDGTAMKIDTDYFGEKRNSNNPFPGPFDISETKTQTIKIWPKP
jgi:alpha-N-arabinofuranosidase